MDIVKKLDLNKNPRLVDNNSLIFAKNIKLDHSSSYFTNDDGFEEIPMPDILSYTEEQIKEYYSKYSDYNSLEEINKLEVYNEKLKQTEDNYNKAKENIENIENDFDEDYKSKINALNKELQEISSELRTINNQIDNYDFIVSNTTGPVPSLETLQRIRTDLITRQNNIFAETKELRENYQSSLENSDEYKNALNEYNKAEEAYVLAQEEYNNVLDEYNANKETYENYLNDRYNLIASYQGSSYSIINACPTNKDLVLFVKNEKNIGFICVFNDDTKETRLVASNWKYNGGNIESSAVYNAKNELIVTFSEYGFDDDILIPIKSINLDDEDILNYDDNDFSISPVIPTANMKLLAKNELATIPNGVYQFFIRYEVVKDNYTAWIPIGSRYYAISEEFKNIINYKSNTNVSTGKTDLNYNLNNASKDAFYGFIFNITIEECNYKYFQLGYIYYGSSSDTVARIFNKYEVKSNIVISFDANYIEETTIDYLCKSVLSLFNVNNIELFDNRLYISNYHEVNNNIDITEAKNIKVRYITETIENEETYSNFKRIYTVYIKRTTGNAIPAGDNFTATAKLEFSLDKTDGYYKLKYTQILCNLLGIDYHDPNKAYCYYGHYSIENDEPIPLNTLYFIVENNRIYAKFTDRDTVVDCSNFVTYPLNNVGSTVLPTSLIFSTIKYSKGTSLYDVSDSKIALLNPKYLTSVFDYKYSNELEYEGTFMPNEIYNFYVHYVDKLGNITNGIKLINDASSIIEGNNATDLIENNIEDYYEFNNRLRYCDVINNASDGVLGYYENSYGDVLFKTPNANGEKIHIYFENITIPEGYVSCFFSYEKIEPTVYEGYCYKRDGRDFYIKATDIELALQNYKGKYIHVNAITDDGTVKYVNYLISNIEIYKSNTIGYSTGKHGFIKITIDDIYNLDYVDNLLKAETFSLFICNVGTSIYHKTTKTLIRYTGYYLSDEENFSTYLNNDSDYNYPSFYCPDPVIIYTKAVTVSDIAVYEISETDLSYQNVITSSFSVKIDFNKYSNFNLAALNVKTEPQILVVPNNGNKDNTTKIITKVVDPSYLTDLFELKSCFISHELKTYANYDSDIEYLEEFNNTIRRSYTFQDESINNAFREFDSDDYLMIPNNKGNIVSLKASGTRFMIHTEHSLFMFDSSPKLKNTTNQDVQLGKTDIFTMSPSEVFASENGYGGLQDKEASCIGLFGYVWYDNDSNQIYCLDGEKSFNILSLPINKILFKHKVVKTRIANEFFSNRLIICFEFDTHDTDAKSMTISYNYAVKQFISLHDFSFNNSWSTKNFCFVTNGNKLYRLSNRVVGYGDLATDSDKIFYFNKDKCIIDIICNESYEVAKSLESISYILSKYNEEEITLDKNQQDTSELMAEDDLDRTYSGETLRIYSDSADTCNIDISQNISNNKKLSKLEFSKYPWYEKGRWNFNYFRNKINRTDLSYDDMSLVYGKYIVVRFIFSNTSKFKLETLTFNIKGY
jgi:predicted DNA-binding protein (MmcQ/YjbR family)